MTLPTTKTWFSTLQVGPGITMIREPYVDAFLRANMFLVEGSKQDLLIDTGMGIAPLRPLVESLRSCPQKPLICVLTHTHSDHMGGAHEFDNVLVHPDEADSLRDPVNRPRRLWKDGTAETILELCIEAGYPPLPDLLVKAIPHNGYDPSKYALIGMEPAGFLSDGDEVDLGDTSFEVIHLPGHSAGSIALFDRTTGVLFSGDVVYDGPLIYNFPGMNLEYYALSLRDLRKLPISLVHGGHDPSFGVEHLHVIIDKYLAHWGAE